MKTVPGRDWLGGGGRKKFEGALRGTTEGTGNYRVPPDFVVNSSADFIRVLEGVVALVKEKEIPGEFVVRRPAPLLLVGAAEGVRERRVGPGRAGL